MIARLRSHPDPKLVQQVVEAMTTNETSFYRDTKPFEVLRTHILPELISKRQQAKTLTVWCGACSTGQEPYTIWMVMKDHFPELAHWRVKIIGTDISTDVLAKAKSGKYTQLEVNRGIPTPILVKHFEREGPFWKIHQDAHRIVEFRELNLIGQWPSMPRPDIVFLRNVMIYFDIATRKQILGRIAQLMAPDGFLFLGAGETTLNIDPSYQRVELDRSGCFRLGTPPSPGTRKEDSWTPRAKTSTL
ncbi:MAG: protein-glutamate O-methyltransferase CheR [Ilumatobacteraceae bacterium]